MSDPRVHRRWRTGRSVGRTIYSVVGDEASKEDELIGMMDTPELAAEAVAWHNRVLLAIERKERGEA